MIKQSETKQKKTFLFSTISFIVCLTITIYIDFFKEIMINGLYHKIIIFYGINIPIGIISSIIVTSLLTLTLILSANVVYRCTVYGIDETITLTEEKKEIKQ